MQHHLVPSVWIPRFAFALATIVMCASNPVPGFAQQSREEFYRTQTLDFQKALDDPRVNRRVQRIWMQLVEDTRQMYPVYPTQQYTMGQSLPNGVIVLDVAIAGNDDVDVTAFWLAHEWAHQTLGHSAMLLTPLGQWAASQGGTSQEDAADRWAGRFLKRHDYDLDPVVEFLCTLPDVGPQDAHSSSDKRARQTARAFGDTAFDGCSDSNPDNEVTERKRSESMQKCLQRKYDRCLSSCQTSWGHPYQRCLVLCDVRNQLNRDVWVPECEGEIGGLAGGVGTARDSAPAMPFFGAPTIRRAIGLAAETWHGTLSCQ